MSDEATAIAKMFGGGGLAAALLYLLYLVGMRLVAAIDRVAIKVDDQGTEIARIGTKVDMLVPDPEPAPVQRVRTGRTPIGGVPAGEGFYSLHAGKGRSQ